MSLPGPMIQEKAQTVAKTRRNFDFKLSYGWLEEFQVAVSNCLDSVCGKSNHVDKTALQQVG